MAADVVPIPSVLLDRLTALGLDVPRLLDRAGILPSRFPAPSSHASPAQSTVARARFTPQELFAFWRAIEELSGARDIGLRVASEALPHHFDVASMAALHSPNYGEALKKFARYKRLVCSERVSVEIGKGEIGKGEIGKGEAPNGEAKIRFHWMHVEEAMPMMLVDATFANLVALGQRGSGAPVTPMRIELARRRADEAMLRRHFGCEIRFDAPQDTFVLAEKELARPFVTHNADLLALMLPGLEAALRESLSRSLADDVKTALSRRMHGERPSVEKIAEDIHVSPRTLQRRLEELGTSYQNLLDDVRRETSLRLLAHTDLETGEVAFILGFEEVNSFTRAFHAWQGTTPIRWRKSERGVSAARAPKARLG